MDVRLLFLLFQACAVALVIGLAYPRFRLPQPWLVSLAVASLSWRLPCCCTISSLSLSCWARRGARLGTGAALRIGGGGRSRRLAAARCRGRVRPSWCSGGGCRRARASPCSSTFAGLRPMAGVASVSHSRAPSWAWRLRWSPTSSLRHSWAIRRPSRDGRSACSWRSCRSVICTPSAAMTCSASIICSIGPPSMPCSRRKSSHSTWWCWSLLYRAAPNTPPLQVAVITGLTLFTTFTFQPARTRVQRWVDQLFYGGWYDYPGVVEQASASTCAQPGMGGHLRHPDAGNTRTDAPARGATRDRRAQRLHAGT